MLARQIYKHATEQLGISIKRLPQGNADNIWDEFKKALEKARPCQHRRGPIYVFVDGIDQLFDTETNGNSETLEAFADLVRAVDKQAGGERLALRFFLPIQLQKPLEKRLGHLKHVHSYSLHWTEEHCKVIVERRLNSSWKEDRTSDLAHLSRLFTPDALYEFLQWLQRQEAVSPRCVISVMNSLADYALRRGLVTDSIKVEIWNDFIAAEKPEHLCSPDIEYPLPPQSRRNMPVVQRNSLSTQRENEDLGTAPELAAMGQVVNAAATKWQSKRRERLHGILTKRFDVEELRTLCFMLEISFEDLPGEGKAAKSRELLLFLERRNRVNEIIQVGQQLRPDIDWEETSGID